MKVGLIDVDGHNFPNLALMRISAYHKAHGDTVEWWWSDFVHYDIVYMSKIFSDTYTADVPEPLNADRVIKGGTGYCIHLGDDGKEHFDKSKNTELPPEIERCFPDYSIYPQFPFAVSMTSRGSGTYTGGYFTYTDADKDLDIVCSVGGGNHTKNVNRRATSVFDASVQLCAEINNEIGRASCRERVSSPV